MTPAQTILVFSALLIISMIFVAVYISNQIKSASGKGETEKMLFDMVKEMKAEMKASVDKGSQTVEEQLRHQRDSMDKQTKMIWERLDNASKVIGGVQKQLGEIGEFSKGMKDLSNVLKSPKLRGGLGEQLLYEILANALPKELYRMQYKFRDGSVCDAAIVTKDVIIPIDAKFSMENFKLMLDAETDEERERVKKEFIRDVKVRIDEIASKYILPEEGTADHAIMYIPSENVFYELIVNTPQIEEYSKKRSVTLASPNTLTYILRSFLLAYRQYELQQHAGEILKALGGIAIEAGRFSGELEVLDGHIGRTVKSMDNVKTKFGKLTGKIESVQALGEVENVPMLADGADADKE